MLSLRQEAPAGVSKAAALFALAKQSKALGAYKAARVAYEKLQKLKVRRAMPPIQSGKDAQIPDQFRELADVGSVTIRSKPHADNDELVPTCHRCSTKNPLLQGDGQSCFNCKTAFVFSAHTCETLPLVEFFLDLDISDGEALSLIQCVAACVRRTDRPQERRQSAGQAQGPEERRRECAQAARQQCGR